MDCFGNHLLCRSIPFKIKTNQDLSAPKSGFFASAFGPAFRYTLGPAFGDAFRSPFISQSGLFQRQLCWQLLSSLALLIVSQRSSALSWGIFPRRCRRNRILSGPRRGDLSLNQCTVAGIVLRTGRICGRRFCSSSRPAAC